MTLFAMQTNLAVAWGVARGHTVRSILWGPEGIHAIEKLNLLPNTFTMIQMAAKP